MQINILHRNRTLFRILATLLLLTAIGATSDCHAQRARGLFARGTRAPANFRQPETPNLQEQLDSLKHSQRSAAPAISRYLNRDSWDPGSGNQRYIGGFHYTHFQNIGIPSGDIGLRGNAYHWRPW